MLATVITLLAALVAAGTGMWNTFRQERFSRDEEMVKWIRTEGRPLFARFLHASKQHALDVGVLAGLTDNSKEARTKASAAYFELDTLYDEIELTAAPDIVRAAQRLMRYHTVIDHEAWEALFPIQGAAEGNLNYSLYKIREVQQEYSRAVRSTLGTSPAPLRDDTDAKAETAGAKQS